MAKDIYYLKHDTNAHRDPRMLRLRAKWGNEGYGVFWVLAELMREQSGGRVLFADVQVMAFDVHFERLRELIDDCCEWGLFEKDETRFWAPRIVRDMEHLEAVRRHRRDAGARGGRATANAKQLLLDPEANAEPAPDVTAEPDETAAIATDEADAGQANAGANPTNESKHSKGEDRKASNVLAEPCSAPELLEELGRRLPNLCAPPDLIDRFLRIMTEKNLEPDYVRFFVGWIRMQPNLSAKGHAGYLRVHFGEQEGDYRLWRVNQAVRKDRDTDPDQYEHAEEGIRVLRDFKGHLHGGDGDTRASPQQVNEA